MIKPNGSVVVNTKYIPPSCTIAGAKPKTTKELIDLIKAKTLNSHQVDGAGIAQKVGNPLVVNTVLLGCPFGVAWDSGEAGVFEKAMAGRLKEKYLSVNLQAFQLGRETILS